MGTGRFHGRRQGDRGRRDGASRRQRQFDVKLSKKLAGMSVPLQADLGLPRLGFTFETEGKFQVAVDYTWRLGFGVNKSNGFYLTSHAGNELDLSVTATIPDTTIQAQLGLLRARAVDDPNSPSNFQLSTGLDLVDRDNDGKVTLGEFDLRQPALVGNAGLHLKLTADFGANSNFPTIATDFVADWTFASDAPDQGDLQIEFRNTQINVGQFVSRLLKPFLDQARLLFEPLQPLFNALDKDIPILSDLELLENYIPNINNLSGTQLTDVVAKALGDSPWGLLFKAVYNFNQLLKMTKDAGGEVYLDMGSFNLTSQADPRKPSFDLETFEPVIAKFDDLLRKINLLAPGDEAGRRAKEMLAAAVQSSRSEGGRGLIFPILEEPAKVFGLFFGKQVDLVRLDLPTFEQGIAIPPIHINVLPSIEASLDFAASQGFQLDMAYDTQGLVEFVGSQDPRDLFNGFYLTDRDEAGVDVPEVFLKGHLVFSGATGYGVAGANIFEANISGGLEITPEGLGLNLRDPNNDGKVRADELLYLLRHNSYNPFALFDLSGKLHRRVLGRHMGRFPRKDP